jgi:hypothetical protein
MPVSRDIVRMYRGPRKVVGELAAMGPREDRAIAWLMIGCFVFFLAQLPVLQRAAVLEGNDFQQTVIYAFFVWLMLMPLVFYLIAFIAFGVTRIFRQGATNYGARLAVFWGWLAATPVALLWGLMVGLNGRDTDGTFLVEALWFAVLLWFWVAGLIETSKEAT